jgi:hypothetical protein
VHILDGTRYTSEAIVSKATEIATAKVYKVMHMTIVAMLLEASRECILCILAMDSTQHREEEEAEDDKEEKYTVSVADAEGPGRPVAGVPKKATEFP